MTARTTATDDRALLRRILEESYDRSTWNGTNLKGSIAKVTAAEARWVPPHARHGIAAIVAHCAYWKHAVRKRLLGERKRTFALEGSDWFELQTPLDEKRWAELVALLDEEHAALRDAVRQADRDMSYAEKASRDMVRQVFGIATHDAYHAGQIHLLRAMHRRKAEG